MDHQAHPRSSHTIADLSDDEDEPARPASEVPSLESLALRVVARHLERYQHLSLPYGGTDQLLKVLGSQKRLRTDVVAPLLSAWCTQDDLSDELGASLAVGARGSRGLAALAAQRLAFKHQPGSRRAASAALPAGTRAPELSMSVAADAAR